MIDEKKYFEAISLSHVMIEFTTEGIIIDANENFLNVMGYELDEIRGQHHSIFVEDNLKQSDQYAQFWNQLRSGHFFNAEVRRINKWGDFLCFEASYNPIKDDGGDVRKILKIALIKHEIMNHIPNVDFDALSCIKTCYQSDCFLEFSKEGLIINASNHYLDTFGFVFNEIKGKHHSVLVNAALAETQEYKNFWKDSINDNFEYKELYRAGKAGKSFWVDTQYEVYYDMSDEIDKIVKIFSFSKEFHNIFNENFLLIYISKMKK
ncbi:MAG: hypothetical protein C0432_03405 [Candidatus Puniceispirillum sp.]|nr:hypothetical protein [Candidatus Pelagibacter sp.]MBA4283321.1 hypothetical protein [Candidatus Puniceispirillum sp.]